MSEYDRRETATARRAMHSGRSGIIFSPLADTFCRKRPGRSPSPTATGNGVWLAQQGPDVVSLDFSLSAQAKAATLARERGVAMTIERGDVHNWDYPEAAFDVVCEIFTQFSTPPERADK